MGTLDDFSLYGRFDFSYDGRNPPKLLEYNADTPTALVEAAVAQWYWLQDTNKNADQFNSIHEKLIAAWKKFGGDGSGLDSSWRREVRLEDAQTVLYLEDTCVQAGLAVEAIFTSKTWVSTARRKSLWIWKIEVVANYFKLYPWEWMWHEEFGQHLKLEPCRFIEPLWKMLLANKGLLPVLWEKFPGHPNLPSGLLFKGGICPGTTRRARTPHVEKPKLSREGANVTIVERGIGVAATDGDYGEEGFVYQAPAPTADFDGNHPVMGVWVVNHEACGLGIPRRSRRKSRET